MSWGTKGINNSDSHLSQTLSVIVTFTSIKEDPLAQPSIASPSIRTVHYLASSTLTFPSPSRPPWSSSRDEYVNRDVGSSGIPVGGSCSSCREADLPRCLRTVFGLSFPEKGVTNQKLASGFGHVRFYACRGGNSEECRNSTCQNDSSLFLCPFIW